MSSENDEHADLLLWGSPSWHGLLLVVLSLGMATVGVKFVDFEPFFVPLGALFFGIILFPLGVRVLVQPKWGMMAAIGVILLVISGLAMKAGSVPAFFYLIFSAGLLISMGAKRGRFPKRDYGL